MRSFWKALALPFALWLAAIPAHAHAKPKVMVPDANSTVSSPGKVSVIFTEALEPKFSSLKLTNEKGLVLSKAASVVDPADHKHMTIDLPQLAPGVYYVHWATAATDGHRMDGQYSFTVK